MKIVVFVEFSLTIFVIEKFRNLIFMSESDFHETLIRIKFDEESGQRQSSLSSPRICQINRNFFIIFLSTKRTQHSRNSDYKYLRELELTMWQKLADNETFL